MPMIVSEKYRGSGEYQLVFNELVKAAQYRGTVTYQELAHIIGLPITGSHLAKEIGHLLGEISEDQVRRGRPMLSAVAVGVDGLPGSGFFEFAEKLEKLQDKSDEGKRHVGGKKGSTYTMPGRRSFREGPPRPA